ncbi:hypothetical protein E3N88_00440 [Mikania micrantha]|uniref:Ubiquitin-like protease family profile domain-containing protein n=1 Tax=Mikania micrantha TaxID=192012 RepID=A0A5N6PY49_9ASTR|nr:hypothetical protein E3N88_00440 [Mikania micrantha]
MINASIPSFSLGLTQETQDKAHGDDEDLITGNDQEKTHKMCAKGDNEAFSIPLGEEHVHKKENVALLNKPTRAKIISEALRSPYVIREVEINKSISKEEELVWNYISGRKKEHVIFEDASGTQVEAQLFQSVMIGRQLYTSVVNSWAVVLNFEEKKEDQTHHIDYSVIPKLSADRMKLMNEHTLRVVGRNEKLLDLRKYDLIFFPIIEAGHFYLVVFDFKSVAVTIIDNMVEEDSLVGLKDNTDFFEKDTSFKVKQIFEEYLEHVHHPKLSELKTQVPVKLKLPWATKKNVTDCGVFVMRHMEMYIGKGAKSFDCGFSKNHFKRTSQIKTLRKKYATRILLSDANNLKHVVIERAFDVS